MGVYPFEHLEEGDRILWIERVAGGLKVEEACDGWFSVVLNHDELEKFIATLRAVAAQPDPEATPNA